MIRELNHKDIDTVSDIYYQIRRLSFDWIDSNEIKIGDFHRDTKGEKVLVAELKGHVVGFISFWQSENFIHHLYVLPDYSSHGVGSQLLASCLKHINGVAMLKCVSANAKALSFYQNKGWKTIDYGASDGVGYQVMQLITRLP